MGRRERKRVFKVQVLEIKSATMMKNVFRDKLYFRENPLLRGEELIRGWKFLSTTSPQISPFLSKNLRINEKIRRNILRTKFRKKEKIPKEKKYPDEANSTPMEQHVRGYTFRSPSHESLSKLYIRESGDEWTGTGSESYAMINGRPLGSASLAHLGPWGPSRGKRCTRVEANARWVLLRTASQHPSWIDRSNNRFWESGREFCPRYFLILPSTSDRRKRKILCS